MLMNRRNVLVGLGVIVVMSGVLLGTGAFSTVEADRSVTVTTAGDSNALIGFNATSEYATYDNGELKLNLSRANTNATITVDKAFEIENNRGDGQSVDLNSTSWTATNSGINVTLKANSQTIQDGDSTGVKMVVKTYDTTKNDEFSETITIRVDSNQ